MKKIGVVILNYNKEKYTIDCVKSVLKGSRKPEWIVVVDNNSADESWRNLEYWVNSLSSNSIYLLRERKNRGYAAGNNAGIKFLLNLGADAIWILNNDTIIDYAALEAMENKLFSRKRPGLCGSLVVYGDNPDKVQCRGGGKYNRWTGLSKLNGNGLNMADALSIDENDIEEELDFIYGASMMISRKFLEEVGLFDEEFFLYREEQDIAIRASNKFDLAYAAQARVTHFGGISTGYETGKFRFSSFLILLKSHFRLIIKHNPCALPTAFGYLVFCGINNLIKRLKNCFSE